MAASSGAVVSPRTAAAGAAPENAALEFDSMRAVNGKRACGEQQIAAANNISEGRILC